MKKSFEKTNGWICVPVSLKVYPLQAIHSAGYVYMDKAHIKLEEDGKDRVSVWLKPKLQDDLDSLALSFCDELLNYAHYFDSLKANGDNMKLLLQRALFSASPALVKAAEENEIEDLIKELEAEEASEKAKMGKKSAKKSR